MLQPHLLLLKHNECSLKHYVSLFQINKIVLLLLFFRKVSKKIHVFTPTFPHQFLTRPHPSAIAYVAYFIKITRAHP